MELLGYGEDSLTLWALNGKLSEILKVLSDTTPTSECKLFYRPSFGRSGGENSAEFGEFDFIILSQNRLYLGESKWDRSPKNTKTGTIVLRDEQLTRHDMLKFYIEQWFRERFSNWSAFIAKSKKELTINKRLAPVNSLLADNIKSFLSIASKHYNFVLPDIKNVLLYLHNGMPAELNPIRVVDESGNVRDFKVVPIDYSTNTIGNFIRIYLGC